ncbi:MAG: fimbrillin family protein [Bacteroidales bacterium]|nr:fimbrillin family protein [Bacteroidales bacterium]
MKKSSFYLTAMLSACVLFSCSKEAEAPVTPEEPEIPAVQGDFIISASSGPVRKTELDGERYITWKSGDAISVWEAGNSSNSNVQLSLVASTAGERIGKFSGTLTPASDNFKLYSIYPYSSSYASDPSAVSVSLPSSVGQVTDVNGLVGVSDFMLGAADLSSEDSEYEMLFTYPLAILDIVVSGQGSCLSEAVAESVTITANTAFVGNATVDLTTGTLTPSDADAGKKLVVTYPSTAAISSAQHAWVAIYPVDLTDASCCFDLKMTNGQEIKFNVNPRKAFEAQKIYTINLTDIDTHVDSGEANPIFFDLVGANSTKGYSLNRANCYMISEGGYYKFAAQKVDKSNVFTGTAPASDGYTAKWLWATSNESKVDFISLGNSGAVNFRAPANANGSTVLAVLDPDGNIVWSWHVWCKPESEMEPYHYGRNNAWLMSDINLGATSKNGTGAYGFYYQWGRKDPFPADPSTCVFNTGVTISGYSSKKGDVTPDAIGYTIAHPTTFLYANDYRTWISTASQADDAQSLWNNVNRNKTNYDPCPAGYCVPVQNGFAWYSVFTASAMTWQTGGALYTDPANVSTFYPAGGYLNGGTLTDAGATVRCWAANLSATPSATANMHAYSLLITLSNQTVKNNEAARSAFGLPVRCMKI